jgi:hypothetical protein
LTFSEKAYLAGDPFCDAFCKFLFFTVTIEGLETTLVYDIGSEWNVSVVKLSPTKGGIPW